MPRHDRQSPPITDAPSTDAQRRRMITLRALADLDDDEWRAWLDDYGKVHADGLTRGEAASVIAALEARRRARR